MVGVTKSTNTRRVIPSTREGLLAAVRSLYEAHGYVALSTPFLEKEGLYARMHATGLNQPIYLEMLGLTEQYAEWREESRTYAGKLRPKWTWEEVVDKANAVKREHGELPSMDWFRKNGHTSLVNTVFRGGKSWGALREAVGSFENSRVRTSRNGMRWLSQPEVSLSDFLYARGIEHKPGELYPKDYAIQTGRRHGQYDLHFVATGGRWIDVEVWGNIADKVSDGKYAITRALKEKWVADNNPNFVGIDSTDCLSDKTLAPILYPWIGNIEPFRFEHQLDAVTETTRWTSKDELLRKCRQIAEAMPDGIFPNEGWLRKRGKYADRLGPIYNSEALRINQWLGGIRNLRALLGQSSESTTKWTPKAAIRAWRDFQETHGVTPTQMFVKERAKQFPPEIVKLAQNIRRAVTTHGVLNEAREGKTAHKVIWTNEVVRSAWHEFELKHGAPPSKYVGTKRRLNVSKELGNEAARIYNSARKLGMLAELKEAATSNVEE